MADPVRRLADLIDDYCPDCKVILTHVIASMVDGQVGKVICRRCLAEHAYLNEVGPKRQVFKLHRDADPRLVSKFFEPGVSWPAKSEEKPNLDGYDRWAPDRIKRR